MATRPSRDVDSDLVLAVHKGPMAGRPWAAFIDGLRVALKANGASLSFRQDEQFGPGVLAASPFPARPLFGARVADDLEVVGPPPGGMAMAYRRIYAEREFLDRSIAEHRDFEQRIMIPSGMTFMRVVRIPAPSGGSAWLAVGRDSTDFDSEEIALVDMLVPHLELSLQTFFAIERERGRSLLASDAASKLDFCWFRLDDRGRILDQDHNAQALLARTKILSRSLRGELVLPSAHSQNQLRAALRELCGKPEGRARALHLSDEPWLDMLIVPARGGSVIERMAPSVIAYVHGEAEPSEGRRELLADLFGLSRNEAELALALCRGRTIREAAASIGITEASAREYSKRVFAKTGTRGQVDLVRLVLTSVVALA